MLEQNAQKLNQGARLLASDYGFKQAVASGDRETISSVLANHGARIGATRVLLIGTDRTIKASTIEMPSVSLTRSIVSMVDRAEAIGTANSTSLVDRRSYQLVVVPVKAPITIGWVAMAFPIDQQLTADMQELDFSSLTPRSR